MDFDKILMNYETTRGTMHDHMQTSEEETKTLKKLDDVDGALIDHWYGDAGDVFQMMASTIETQLCNSIRFSDCCAVGNDQMIIAFTDVDTGLSESLNVKVCGH